MGSYHTIVPTNALVCDMAHYLMIIAERISTRL